jgi:hypothetical protein
MCWLCAVRQGRFPPAEAMPSEEDEGEERSPPLARDDGAANASEARRTPSGREAEG